VIFLVQEGRAHACAHSPAACIVSPHRDEDPPLIRTPAQASSQAFVSLLVAALVVVLLTAMIWPL
jgi:hypothetical protein